MSTPLSPNTQAILLLTAPLIAGKNKVSTELLTLGEYKKLARHLREMQCQPSDLIAANAATLLRDCHTVVDEARLQRLLGRGFLLSQVMERWQARAIWVISRADTEYPRTMKTRLREDAPAILYGCGDRGLLEAGGLAVVGSRNVDDALMDYTMAVGHMAARSGRTLVSGGAKGVDQAAMRGALEAGGNACGVLADSLEKTIMNRENRNWILNEQLVLVSPYDPNAGFQVGHAMQRNKLIYALSDAALVVNADLNKGGTWAGAVEQLDKLHFVPVYVRSSGTASNGLEVLREKGALPWTNPQDAEEFNKVFTLPPLAQTVTPVVQSQVEPFLFPVEETLLEKIPNKQQEQLPISTAQIPPDERLLNAVWEVIQPLFKAPVRDKELANTLHVSIAQVREWLKQFVEKGMLEKQKKPVAYVLKSACLFK
ncbi:MAG: hypothetical protein RIR79_426 [Pseudomonadota bacterium]|jgi:predicted Rossmann fold nucleotide-binding protein DprA/Smf involved in DNA uptake